MARISELEAMFHPRRIAVVGAKRENPAQGWLGMLSMIRQFGFPGRIYPINPKATEVDGLKAYPSVASLPEPVDLVIISVPAAAVPDALRDCMASGNKNVHIFTAGFKETGEEEGIKLQQEIEQIAQSGGLRVVGPNCMGLYVPKARLVTWAPASAESGSVAFVTQSGGHAGDFTNYAGQFGIRFSKVISYGNALTLDCTDFLEYLAQDTETSIITMYLEGVKDGRKLLKLVREINKTKPVIIMKGGLTESGRKAVASHTGSLAGGEQVWGAFFKQSGAVRVTYLDEICDVTLAFLHLQPPLGRRVAIVGTGGGISVGGADACAREGLEVPTLTPETRKHLRGFIPIAGQSIMNPIDAHMLLMDISLLERALDLVSADPLIDMLIVYLHIDWLYDMDQGAHVARLASYLAGVARDHMHGKPYAISWGRYRAENGLGQAIGRLQQELLRAGVPVYQGLPRAARALARWADYHQSDREGNQ